MGEDSARARSAGGYRGRGIHGDLVDTLGRSIVRGDLPPGSTLDMAAIRAERDVSLSALREAIRVLAGKGLIEARQKRGTTVRPQREWDMLDPDLVRWQAGAGTWADTLRAFEEVRRIIEPSVARLAAERRSAEDLDALREALDAMTQRAGEPSAHAAADVRFHRALYEASGNPMLARLGSVFEAVLEARDVIVHGSEHTPDPSEVEAAHRAVLDAVRQGAPAKAAKAMQALLTVSQTAVALVTADEGATGG